MAKVDKSVFIPVRIMVRVQLDIQYLLFLLFFTLTDQNYTIYMVIDHNHNDDIF